MALRLFLIAAHLDPQKLGPSSLLGMSLLASTPAEVRKYRAMAFLLDPKGDAKCPEGGCGEAGPNIQGPGRRPAKLSPGMQCYRVGNIEAARESAAPGVDKIFRMAPA